MEFLGDAVLELVVSEYLFKNFPDKTEGFLTSVRASLVNAEILAQIAEELKFSRYLLISKGEAKDLQSGRHYILANTFEALIGAIYLDAGYKKCQRFIEKYVIRPHLENILKEKLSCSSIIMGYNNHFGNKNSTSKHTSSIALWNVGFRIFDSVSQKRRSDREKSLVKSPSS